MGAMHNLQDYEGLAEVFEWRNIYGDTDWDAPDELNVAHEVCDRHATDRGRVALYFVGHEGERERITFWELSRWSNGFAAVLDDLGIEEGDRVFSYTPRIPEGYVALLGTLKHGAVFGSIDERYGPDRIAYRLNDSEASAVLTTPENRETVADAVDAVPSVEHVIVVSDDGTGIRRDDVSYYEAVSTAPLEYETARTSASDPALLYYTSGTTGPAKGVIHGHRWIAGIAAAQLYAGDLQQAEPDLFWAMGGLGWLTAPVHTLGGWFWANSLLAYEGEVDPGTWATLLDEFPITIVSSTPALYHELRENDAVLDGCDLDLRHALSTGAPLDAELIEWADGALGTPIHDTYGQVETGTMLVNNYPTVPIRSGSMGKPLPGVTVEVVDPESGEPLDPGETGEIAVDGDFPCFFFGYWEDPDRTEGQFVNDRYLTGDLGHEDEDGYFWFEGRADDLIVSEGSRIGPFEIERVVRDHEAVTEVAAAPDPDSDSAVVAYVVPDEGADPSDDLADAIRADIGTDLTEREIPDRIEFVDALPKTATGRVRRSELRE